MTRRVRRPPTRKDGEKRREALIDAALACFYERGVQRTGIEHVRKKAGASPSSVYHHFAGLPALTLALLVRTFERLFGHLDVRTRDAKTAEELVRALVLAHLEWVEENRVEAAVMYQVMSVGLQDDETEALVAAKAEALLPVVMRLGAYMQAGALPARSPLEIEILAFGPVHEACRRWLAGAPLDLAWMQTELPASAWALVSMPPASSTR